jgi:hypothetical protein
LNTAHLPVILIELVLVVGGLVLFGWWQLRSVRRDRDKAAAMRAAKAAFNPVSMASQVHQADPADPTDPTDEASRPAAAAEPPAQARTPPGDGPQG